MVATTNILTQLAQKPVPPRQDHVWTSFYHTVRAPVFSPRLRHLSRSASFIPWQELDGGQMVPPSRAERDRDSSRLAFSFGSSGPGGGSLAQQLFLHFALTSCRSQSISSAPLVTRKRVGGELAGKCPVGTLPRKHLEICRLQGDRSEDRGRGVLPPRNFISVVFLVAATPFYLNNFLFT